MNTLQVCIESVRPPLKKKGSFFFVIFAKRFIDD
jgi:hypothetical protein